jgi:hypothetical protein
VWTYWQIQRSHAAEGGLTVIGGAIFLGSLDVKSRLPLNIPRMIEVDSITHGNFEKGISRFEKDAAYVYIFSTFITF